jgi:hypothetical protein
MAGISTGLRTLHLLGSVDMIVRQCNAKRVLAPWARQEDVPFVVELRDDGLGCDG